MAAAGHAVGHHRRQQRLDAGEEGDGERRGQQFEQTRRSDLWHAEGRQGAGDAAEARADGIHRQSEQDGGHRGDDHREQETRCGGRQPAYADDDAHAAQGHGQCPGIEAVQVPTDRRQLGQEFGRQLRRLQPEKILDLAREDDDGDAGGEAGDQRLRQVFHQRADAQQAGHHQDDAGHQRGQHQSIVAMADDDRVHDRDEGAGRPADLETRSAQGRDQEAGDDGGDQARAGIGAAGHGQGHRQGQRDDGDGEAGDAVRAQVVRSVTFAQHRHQLRMEMARHGLPPGAHGPTSFSRTPRPWPWLGC